MLSAFLARSEAADRGRNWRQISRFSRRRFALEFAHVAQPALLPQTAVADFSDCGNRASVDLCGAIRRALGWHLVRGAWRNHPSSAAASPGQDADVMPRADELLGAPTPAPLAPSPAPAGTAVSRALLTTRDLVGQARSLRQRGDTNAALARLREAQLTAPADADVLAEMAVVYEQVHNPELAIELWQRIYEQGNTAGPAYYLAEIAPAFRAWRFRLPRLAEPRSPAPARPTPRENRGSASWM